MVMDGVWCPKWSSILCTHHLKSLGKSQKTACDCIRKEEEQIYKTNSVYQLKVQWYCFIFFSVLFQASSHRTRTNGHRTVNWEWIRKFTTSHIKIILVASHRLLQSKICKLLKGNETVELWGFTISMRLDCYFSGIHFSLVKRSCNNN